LSVSGSLNLSDNLDALSNVFLPNPADGEVLIFQASTQLWIAGAGGGGSSPLTNKGDIFGFDTVNARIPVGANNSVLIADPLQGVGVKYALIANINIDALAAIETSKLADSALFVLNNQANTYTGAALQNFGGSILTNVDQVVFNNQLTLNVATVAILGSPFTGMRLNVPANDNYLLLFGGLSHYLFDETAFDVFGKNITGLNYLEADAITTPSTPDNGKGRYYTKEVATITTPFFIGDDGLEISLGDVNGPATSVDNRIATFDGLTGKIIQSSTAFVNDLGLLSAQNLAVTTPGGRISFARNTRYGVSTINNLFIGDLHGLEQVSSADSQLSVPMTRIITSGDNNAGIGFGMYTNATNFIYFAIMQQNGDLDVLTHSILNLANPINPQDATSQIYVDSGNGFQSIGSVDVASTGSNIFTVSEQTIDGVLTNFSRVLLKEQTLPKDNGTYLTQGVNPWIRTSDGDTAAELNNVSVFVIGGTINAGSTFIQTATIVTLNTDPVVFQDINSVVVKTNQAHTYDSGQKQTFIHSVTTAGLRIAPASNRPSSQQNGDLIYNNTAQAFEFRQNGLDVTLGATVTPQAAIKTANQLITDPATDVVITGLSITLPTRAGGFSHMSIFLLISPTANNSTAIFEILDDGVQLFERLINIGDSSETNSPVEFTFSVPLDGSTITVSATTTGDDFTILGGGTNNQNASTLTSYEVS